jgi:hypothetical protein
MTSACEHAPGIHDGDVPSRASAPEASRAWLLIEHDGPWAREAHQSTLPGDLGKIAAAAHEAGVRVQLIRRPERAGRTGGSRVFAAWAADPSPWLVSVPDPAALDPEALARGESPEGGAPVERLYLVCTHGRRDRCCARLGGPLARSLAKERGDEVWETTHVGGHKFAANLVLLPHGRYYGPCDLAVARDAIAAYENGGAVVPGRYRGRAGQSAEQQEADCSRI